MNPIAAVFRKEVLENVRDRRTLMSALFFAPLFGPILFAVIIKLSLASQISDLDQMLVVPVTGAQHAPNLIAFLTRNNVDVLPVDGDPQTLVKDGAHELVLVIVPEYAERFVQGRPAPVQLVADNSNTRDRKSVARVQGLLYAYERQIARLRLQARGVNPLLVSPIALRDVDVSTREGRAILVLGMITYFVLFAGLMGGMYLAIDATAGERDRNSLESLLSLPVPRSQLMVGKIAATALFMLASVAISIAAFYFGIKIVPLERLDMSANFDALVAVKIFLVLVPFVLFGAGLMMVVATFTKTHKEAQTYLSVLLAVPTVPIIFAAVLGLRPSTALMTVPSLAQHLMITNILKDEPIAWSWLVVSTLATGAIGLVLCYLATSRYRRESILM